MTLIVIVPMHQISTNMFHSTPMVNTILRKWKTICTTTWLMACFLNGISILPNPRSGHWRIRLPARLHHPNPRLITVPAVPVVEFGWQEVPLSLYHPPFHLPTQPASHNTLASHISCQELFLLSTWLIVTSKLILMIASKNKNDSKPLDRFGALLCDHQTQNTDHSSLFAKPSFLSPHWTVRESVQTLLRRLRRTLKAPTVRPVMAAASQAFLAALLHLWAAIQVMLAMALADLYHLVPERRQDFRCKPTM